MKVKYHQESLIMLLICMKKGEVNAVCHKNEQKWRFLFPNNFDDSRWPVLSECFSSLLFIYLLNIASLQPLS